MSHSLQLYELQRARPPCPIPTPESYSDSCPLSQWCHPTISPSVIPFSSCLQSFPTSGSFLMIWLFTSGGQSIGSFSFNISPSNEHPGLISFRMDWWYLLAVQGTLKSLQHHSLKASFRDELLPNPEVVEDKITLKNNVKEENWKLTWQKIYYGTFGVQSTLI